MLSLVVDEASVSCHVIAYSNERRLTSIAVLIFPCRLQAAALEQQLYCSWKMPTYGTASKLSWPMVDAGFQ